MNGQRFLPVLGFALLAGCGDEPAGIPVANLPPHVRITGGPLEGARDSYRSRVYWSGWDDDGTVVRYEYAVDPPGAFSPDEIAAPEAHPDLALAVIRGPGPNQDTLRVTKLVDGVPLRFDYVQTLDTDRVFSLTATQPESVSAGGRLIPRGTSREFHTLHVRAVDNEGAHSAGDRLAFNAYTYAPSAHIVFPFMGNRDYLITGGRIRVNWYGVDPDPAEAQFPVPGFYWKLVDLKALDPPLSIFRDMDPDDVLFRRSAHVPWTYQSADTSTLLLFVEPSEYVFAVRAVDAAGAVEPFVDFRRDDEPGNAFRFLTTETGGTPTVTLMEPTLGRFEYRGASQMLTTEVPTGVPLHFHWSASAAQYGGRIEATSYGLDIADLEADGPSSGWSPWAGSITATPQPILFRKPGYHVFYVRVRDSAGKIQIASLGITAFDISLHRPLLVVDDYRTTLSFASDVKHDAFWEQLVRDSGRFAGEDQVRETMWFDAGGDRDIGYLNNAPPPLSLIGQYRLTVWIVHGEGWCARTSLLQAAVQTSTLRSYVAAGGQLWILGSMSLGSLQFGEDCRGLPSGNTAYPQSIGPGDFAYDVLRLASGRVNNDKGARWENTMAGVEAWNPDAPLLPGMEVDGSKFHPVYWGERALTHSEAVFDPVDLTGHPRPGVLDSLYAYVAANEVRPLKGHELKVSPYRDRLCATRWDDPDPAGLEGRVMWFGFPMYFMYTEHAQETFNRAVDWFREEEPPPPRAGGLLHE